MDSSWLEVSDADASSENLMRQVRERLESREGTLHSPGAEDAKSVAEALWTETVTDPSTPGGETGMPIQLRDCDIVPRGYEIDWRVPIVGRVHAIVRRIVNDEIRRYLLHSLEKQSAFNRDVLQALVDLARENACLRQEVDSLREARREQGV